MIRLTIPSIEEDDLRAVSDVLATGSLVQGAHVLKFERMVADYIGVKEAVAVSNGTAAIHLALLSCGIGPGDIVVTAAYSFPATANAVELCGATPVFVDIEPHTFNMDPERLETVVRSLKADHETAPRLKAILPVHVFGQLADMQHINAIADRYGLAVIEDAACALGASRGTKKAGAWGKLGCFSFHPRKAITTGEGGMVVTDDPRHADRVRALRNHGMDPHTPSPTFVSAGFNYRLTDFQGALGVSQMAKVDRIIAARRRLASRYDDLLRGMDLRLPVTFNGSNPVYQSYVVLLDPDSSKRRAELISTLKAAGVETTIGTWHIPMTPFYREKYGFFTGSFPVADDVFARALTLPLYESLSVADQSEVVRQLSTISARVAG